ncbi:LOW QUALITY PROTEIN: hypothetical protein PHMEG_00027736 [Phytophthora megakarya]|uniref:Uncharacterized protein n=1 Tax=Phytophthora megakarya TaxID=4795 RepID=A0A225V4W7_9STRA|nr:LOW QUALITY PROTEIN: hypothetical protein PHMEG_00027736 [Phytophthora megakarya]
MDMSISPEKSFSTNVREHLCMALELWTWGPYWTNQAITHTKVNEPDGGCSFTTPTLHELFSKLQAKSLATSSTIWGTWAQLTRWCQFLHFPGWLPEGKERHSYQLTLLATYCGMFGWNRKNTGNTASTVLAKLSHVLWYDRQFCGYNDCLTLEHQHAISGIRREDPPPNPKLPITLQFIERLHKFLNFNSAQHHMTQCWASSFF